MPAQKLEEVVSLCKRRGFVFPGSEIYGGLANTWDYGPMGAELKKNVKDLWWNHFVRGREDIVGLDAAILMNPRTWEASGHVAGFSDPLVDCKSCKSRFRADKIVEEAGDERPENWAAEKTPAKDMVAFLNAAIPCPKCGEKNWTEPKNFNLMFKTRQGVTEDSGAEIYLRPETAQGIFVNFKSVQQTSRKKLPFGIGQIGKAFRNEITPGNFTFRTREFEQMEIEYFFDPETTDWKTLFEDWKKTAQDFFENRLGISSENLHFRDHEADELSHYSRGTTDVEYKFPFGWGELAAAVAYRTDFDLKQHEEFSGEKLKYRDESSGREFVPHVMEPSYGADRMTLAVLIDAYTEESLEDGTSRIVLKFAPRLAPVKFAILPLMKKDGLAEKAREIFTELSRDAVGEYDEGGSIGKRYRRQDEIGTPLCITVDYDTLTDETVTIRDRDTMEQHRAKIAELGEILREKMV